MASLDHSALIPDTSPIPPSTAQTAMCRSPHPHSILCIPRGLTDSIKWWSQWDIFITGWRTRINGTLAYRLNFTYTLLVCCLFIVNGDVCTASHYRINTYLCRQLFNDHVSIFTARKWFEKKMKNYYTSDPRWVKLRSHVFYLVTRVIFCFLNMPLKLS